MNWYLKNIFAQATGMLGYLESLGATPDIVQYISSLDPNFGQILINEFRKNPSLTIEQLQEIQSPQEIQPYTEHELRKAVGYPEPFKKWLLVNLRKIRISKETAPPNQKQLIHSYYMNFIEDLPNLYDWATRSNPNLDLSSYDASAAMDASDEWHNMMAGAGEGKGYEPTIPQLVLYGPEWKNPEWQGWTIQKVISENDLLAEGNIMNHCVGSYCEDVQSGNSTIYSLRDPGNNPKVTIETNSYNEAVQIQGNSNSNPDDQYKAMIKEWLTGDKNPGINSFEEGEDPLNEISYGYDSIEDVVDIIESLGDGEYGIPRKTNWTPKDMAEMAIDMEEHRREPSYDGAITDMPDAIINFAIKEYGDSPETLANMLRELEEYAQSLEEKIYDYAHSNWDMSWMERPSEEDFETNEEFLKAEDEALDAEGDYIGEEVRKTLQGGLSADLFKIMNKLREKKIIPEYVHEPEVVASSKNWYKHAGPVVQFLSYDSYDEFKVLINGQTYVYYDVSPFWSERLQWMIKKLPPGVVIQKLKNFSNPQRYKELHPPEDHTKQEKQEMLNELDERGLLGNN